MYLEIFELDEKVGEVHVNPYSYTYNGQVDEIESQLEEWDEDGGYVTYGAANLETENGMTMLGETLDAGDRVKLLEIGSRINDLQIDVKMVDDE